MMKNLYHLIVALLIVTVGIAQEDCKDCKDHAVLPRMPQFYLEKYTESEFDAQDFYFDAKKHRIEGKKLRFQYRHLKSNQKDFKFPTRLQILRNYSNAIQKAGGKVLFERHNAEHGYYNFTTVDQKNTWVKITPAMSGNSYVVIIIEQEEMRQDIVINADLIAEKLTLYGKIELEGIFFDAGKATIKSSSKQAISELAKYLKAHPTIKCWVVGHTSSEGSFDTNSNLSLKRAQSITSSLEQNHNIASGRLFAEGVGPLAPIASNSTEEGKKMNRRVELVLK